MGAEIDAKYSSALQLQGLNAVMYVCVCVQIHNELFGNGCCEMMCGLFCLGHYMSPETTEVDFTRIF